MATLAIDRATDAPNAAVDFGGDIKAFTLEGCDARSGDWVLRLRDALSSFGLKFGDIDRFIVGQGPGSFAGTRSALAFVQALALPSGKGVFGLPSPAGMTSAGGAVTVVGDARRGLFWVVSYDGAIETSPLRLVAREELPGAVPQCGTVRTSDGERIAPVLAEVFGDRFERSQKPVAGIDFPSAARLLEVAREAPGSLAAEPLPIYLSPAVRA